MTDPISSFNEMSLAAIRCQFGLLDPPASDSLHGLYRGVFVGPGWLLRLWPPLLALTGLGGWWGKEFDDGHHALNLVVRQGRYQRIFPMYPVRQVSYLDRRPGLALRYQKGNPFPWPLIIDELRRIDAQHILGMTLVDLGPLRRLAFPFILQAREALDGL